MICPTHLERALINVMSILKKNCYGMEIRYSKSKSRWVCKMWDDLETGNIFLGDHESFEKAITETFTRFQLERAPFRGEECSK